MPKGKRVASYIETTDVSSRESKGYSGLHAWMNRNYPRAGRCEWCGQTERRTEYAVARHDRFTRNRADWLELCRSCHMRFDGTYPKTEEHRNRISKAHQGVPLSEAHRATLRVPKRPHKRRAREAS